MPKIDCWRLLGLSPGARADQVRAAFAQRARDVHPDGGGSGDGLTMRLLVEARDEALELASRPHAGERPRPRAAAGPPPQHCFACGREVPRERPQAPSRLAGLRLRFGPRKAPICAACARVRKAYDPEQRNRRMLLTTFALSAVATVALTIYLLQML
jgi:hypothetical protein